MSRKTIIAIIYLMAMAAAGQRAFAQEVLLEDIEIRGNRRIPKETVLYSIQSKPGDVYNETAIRRDFAAVIGMGVFDPIAARLSSIDGPRGGKIVIFEVKEYPIIRDIQYKEMHSVTESEVLTRFKERRLGVSKESPFDPQKANIARNAIRELLAEKGHPNASVEIIVEDISATSVALIYNVKEGERVRVKSIEFLGSTEGFTQRRLRGAMKLVKEAGLLTTFSSKDIYFKDKLMHDLELLRFFLGTKGYLQAKIGDPEVAPDGIVTNGFPLPIPKLRKKGPGLKIVVPIEVGRRYKISKVEERGVTIFPSGVVKAVSGLKERDWVDAKKIQENVYKGIKDLYGTQGYIQASPEFIPKFIDKTEEEGEVEITLEVDEGRQFSLRRMEFIGNVTTRDHVLRREVVLNEGDPYNKRYWDLSILKLNQLGLFEEIKEKDAITRTNDRDQTLEIDLQVKEKGRQQITLNGGVSGYAGSFFGIGYSTNNLLGYGQTVSLNFSGGNRQMSGSFGYTAPYLFGRPLSLGFQLFAQRQQYFGNSYNTFSNFYTTGNLTQAELDSLFSQETVGGSLDFSAPLSVLTRRFRKYTGFTRVGLSYYLATSRIKDPKVNTDADTTNDIPVSYSQPKIITSRITPSLYYNSLNAAIDPTRGQSLHLGLSFAGGVLGGDVRTISPSIEYKFFKPVLYGNTERPHVFGMRFQAGHVRSFGKLLDTQSLSFVGGVPITERYFLGGENDVRGYNIYSISPVVRYDYFRSTQNVTAKIKNSAGELVDITDGSIHPSVLRAFTFDAPGGACGEVKSPGCNVERIVREDADGKEIPFYTAVGGDTRMLFNFEYRVPIAGPVSLAAFTDIGAVFNLKKYKDQIVTSNFVDQTLTPNGLIVNSSGTIATRDELDSAVTPSGSDIPAGFRQIYLDGESRSYNLLRLSQSATSFMENLRASVGMEFRVQVPVINVPFRLIFAYNPNANPDITDPRVLSLERRTVVRFSIGRTF
jgi:outer membrane protein insertion porin family